MGTVRSCWFACWSSSVALPAVACAVVLAGSVGTAAAGAAVCGTDEFAGDTLDDARWDVLRPASGAGPVVADGKLTLPIRAGDLFGGTASAENVVIQDAPNGGWTATLQLESGDLDANGEQAGLVLWKGEGAGVNAFGKVVAIQTNAGVRRYEAIWTDGSGLAVPLGSSGADVSSLPADAQLRIRYDGRTAVAEHSPDGGLTWTQIGRPARYAGPLRVGAFAVGGAGAAGTVDIERFDLACGPEVTVSATPATGTSPLAVNLASIVSEAGAQVHGASATAPRQRAVRRSRTPTRPGTYRVELSATGANGVTTVGTARVPCARPGPRRSTTSSRATSSTRAGRSATAAHRAERRRRGPAAHRVRRRHARRQRERAQRAPPAASADRGGRDDQDRRLRAHRHGGPGGHDRLALREPEQLREGGLQSAGEQSYWFERSRSEGTGTTGGNSGAVNGPVPGTVYLRITSSGGANPTLTPESSLDGTTWSPVQGAFELPGTGPVKVGLTYFSGEALRGRLRLVPGGRRRGPPGSLHDDRHHPFGDPGQQPDLRQPDALLAAGGGDAAVAHRGPRAQ